MNPGWIFQWQWLAVLICLTAIGCGGDEFTTCSGEVTLDGQPLAEGTIEFRPADGNGPTAGTLIKQGRYEVRTTAGEKIAIIQAFRITGEEPANPNDSESPLVPVREVIAVDRYTPSSQTKVNLSGEEVDFHLKSID